MSPLIVAKLQPLCGIYGCKKKASKKNAWGLCDEHAQERKDLLGDKPPRMRARAGRRGAC